jgi:pimeloyl-ACP methyl ester carboxylesterase
VVNLMEFEDLRGDVVLLGHSYAGLVVTGAANRVPDRISQVVYLDTGPIPGGTALIETFPTEARRHIERRVEERGNGWGSLCRHGKSWPPSAAWKGWMTPG